MPRFLFVRMSQCDGNVCSGPYLRVEYIYAVSAFFIELRMKAHPFFTSYVILKILDDPD